MLPSLSCEAMLITTFGEQHAAIFFLSDLAYHRYEWMLCYLSFILGFYSKQ